jgi:hypothetical protein
MRFLCSMKCVAAGLLVIVLSACGTCPKLLYKGPMTDEDLAFLRASAPS